MPKFDRKDQEPFEKTEGPSLKSVTPKPTPKRRRREP